MQPNSALSALAVLIISVCVALPAHAHHPPGVEYKVFRFPEGKAPVINGDTSDWERVPPGYTLDGSHLEDTVMGKGMAMDPADLAVQVTVGWSPETNRLYFLYRMRDDFHSFARGKGDLQGDIFEVVLDADHSGGRYHTFDDVTPEVEEQLKSALCQNYHIFTPPAPGPGRPWAWVWGPQQWLVGDRYSQHAYRFEFAHGDAGELVLEFCLTPFSYASYRGPLYSARHRLAAGQIIGLSWSVLDYDESDVRYEGFWMSHATRMDMTADLLPNFRLD